MATFVVSYDLVKRKDYPELWKEFDRLDAVKCLRSVYLLSANNTAKQIRDHFKAFIDDDDQLVVVEFSIKPETYRPLQGTTKWIDSHFS